MRYTGPAYDDATLPEFHYQVDACNCFVFLPVACVCVCVLCIIMPLLGRMRLCRLNAAKKFVFLTARSIRLGLNLGHV